MPTEMEWIDPNSERAAHHWKRVLSRAGLYPKDILRGMPRPGVCEYRARSGVYFLWFGPALAYVGQSKEVATRVGRHEDVRDGRVAGRPIQFDRATYLDLTDHAEVMTPRESAALVRLEAIYIKTYQPPYNWKGR